MTPRRLIIILWLSLLALPVWAQPGPEDFSTGRPPLVDRLGEDRAVKLTGVNETNGRVVWFNDRLAAEMGIELPPGRVMTPELEAELMRHLSWRLLKPGEDAAGRPTVDMYADRYGGDGIGYNKGAGRAAFFGRYNLNIKGVGVTPLVDSRTGFDHSHGGAPLSEGVLEAVWGEVGNNLFNRGSTRILAVIDLGDYTEWRDGGRERRALIIRAGHQLRPAHVLAEGFSGPENFRALLGMFEGTKTLVKVGERVDLAASLETVTDHQARTAAELYRYRILHGGLSAGNKSFDGGMLDLGTVTSQPRTAPIHVLEYKDYRGDVLSWLKWEQENQRRISDLNHFRRILAQNAREADYEWRDVDVSKAYEASYRKHLERELLEASGLKPEAAEALRKADPRLVQEYVGALRGLAKLTNDVDMNIEKSTVARGSVVDIFGALGKLPAEALNGGVSAERLIELLGVDADASNRAETMEKVRAGAERLARLHERVLEGAFTHGGRFYDGREGFERSVIDRAAFENKPMDALFRSELGPKLKGMITAYESGGDPEALRAEMERLMSSSMRDVENLMLGGSRVLPDGSLQTGEATVEGLTYGVRSAPDGARLLRVELPLVEVDGGYRAAVGEGPHMDRGAAESVRYRYTTDGWSTHGEVGGRISTGAGGKLALVFDVPVEGGHIRDVEGLFRVGDGWIKNAGGNFRGYRYAAPDGADLERLRAKVETRKAGPGFGPRRRGAIGALTDARGWAPGETERVFEAVREAAADRAHERAGTLTGSDRADALAGAERVRGLDLEVERSGDIDARYDAQAGKVRVTTGLLNAIDERAAKLPEAERPGFRRRALGLILGHELAHGAGIKGERMADREGVESMRRLAPLTEAEVRETLRAFNASGRLSLLERVRAFARYGPGRAGALASAARGEADRFAKYRRADGTLRWKPLLRDGAIHEGVGAAKFGLALFLKEFAAVAATGDRVRIEEFFDGLMTTDFYAHYGMFVLGARAGEVAYTRYLQRFVKPQWVSGILKTNMALAAGIALPQLVSGEFTFKGFIISVGSLGLSSAAVSRGARAIKWVYDLKHANKTGLLTRLGLAGGRLAKVGGFVYQAAELAIVLTLAEWGESKVNAWLDLREARGALAEAGEAFFAAAGDPRGSAESIGAAAEDYHAAWGEYRNFLYTPLHQDEALFADRLAKVSRRARISTETHRAMVEKLALQPALKANIIARHGSLESYAKHLSRPELEELERDVRAIALTYERARNEHMQEVYGANVRGGALLDGVPDALWNAGGSRSGDGLDRYGARSDFYARKTRERSQAAFRRALHNASENRLEAYADEAELLAAARDALRARGEHAQADAVDAVRDQVLQTGHADRRMIEGHGFTTQGTGAGKILQDALGR